MTATLLAVDDSKTMRKVIEITFAGENYRMVLAESPADALSKLKAEKPAVALVDALLNGASGYDLCQQIKAEAPQVGVIVLSSKQHPYDRVKGGAVGADDYIDKPYDTQALIDKVAAVIQKIATAPARPAAAPAAAPRPAAAAASPPAQQPPAAAAAAGASAAAAGAQQQARPHTTTMSFGAPKQAATPNQTAAAPVAAPAATASRPQPIATGPAAAQPSAATTAARPSPVQAVAPPMAAPIAAAPTAAAAPAGAQVAALVDASMESKLTALGLTKDQITGVLALSREVVEQVVWEVVPVLAETMIREEIRRLTAE